MSYADRKAAREAKENAQQSNIIPQTAGGIHKMHFKNLFFKAQDESKNGHASLDIEMVEVDGQGKTTSKIRNNISLYVPAKVVDGEYIPEQLVNEDMYFMLTNAIGDEETIKEIESRSTIKVPLRVGDYGIRDQDTIDLANDLMNLCSGIDAIVREQGASKTPIVAVRIKEDTEPNMFGNIRNNIRFGSLNNKPGIFSAKAYDEYLAAQKALRKTYEQRDIETENDLRRMSNIY